MLHSFAIQSFMTSPSKMSADDQAFLDVVRVPLATGRVTSRDFAD